MEITNTVGRRKTSVARVYVSAGTGNIIVNKRKFEEYFTTAPLRYVATQALNEINVLDKYDIKANIKGGGTTGQAEALRLGIARALCKINPDDRKALKIKGFLTRDPREVERKKPGRPGARKRFQFSKR